STLLSEEAELCIRRLGIIKYTHSPGFDDCQSCSPAPHSTRWTVVVKHFTRGPLTTPSRRAWRIWEFFWLLVVEQRPARALDNHRPASTVTHGACPSRRGQRPWLSACSRSCCATPAAAPQCDVNSRTSPSEGRWPLR